MPNVRQVATTPHQENQPAGPAILILSMAASSVGADSSSRQGLTCVDADWCLSLRHPVAARAGTTNGCPSGCWAMVARPDRGVLTGHAGDAFRLLLDPAGRRADVPRHDRRGSRCNVDKCRASAPMTHYDARCWPLASVAHRRHQLQGDLVEGIHDDVGERKRILGWRKSRIGYGEHSQSGCRGRPQPIA